MLDYAFLKIFWWVLIGLVLIIYATTAGYDSGITIIMPFLKKEKDRQVVINTSAPVWDGNMTWIVFAGGGLFVIWPVVYATAFSGFYAAMLCILWTTFFRPTGFDYRSKINSHAWRRFWDFGLFISGAFPVWIFGVILGNCFLGFPFHFDSFTFRDTYAGGFNGLMTGFGILAGFVSLLMIIMHGAAYMQRRTEGHLRELGHKLFYFFAIWTLITFSIAGFMVAFSINGYTLISSPPNATLYPMNNVVSRGVGVWIDSYVNYPWKYYAPVIAYLSLFCSLWTNYLRWVVSTFWLSAVAVGGIITTAGATLFPFIMPSSTNPDQSLTVWNSTSSQYALDIMFYIGIALLVVIFCYKLFAFHTIWSKKQTVTEQDLADY